MTPQQKQARLALICRAYDGGLFRRRRRPQRPNPNHWRNHDAQIALIPPRRGSIAWLRRYAAAIRRDGGGLGLLAFWARDYGLAARYELEESCPMCQPHYLEHFQ